MTAVNDPAFAASVSVIKQFLKDQEMFETLNIFEKELSQKDLEFNSLEIPSLLQLTQGFLDLELKECIGSKNSNINRSVGFPVLKDSIKSSASVVSCVCSDSAVVIGSTDKVVRIYKDFNNEPIHQIKQDQVVLCMDICNDLLLTSGMAGQTQLFNLKTLEIIFKLKDHTKYVSSCGFSKDGNMFYTGSHDGFLNIYDLDQSKQTQKMSHSKQFKGAIESCCMADDLVYVSVRGDCFIHVLNLKDFTCVERNMNSNGDDWVSFTALHLSISPDGSNLLILTDTPAGRFLVFNTLSWKKVADIWGGLTIDRFSHPRGMWIDSRHFCIGDDDGYLSLWNVDESKHIGKTRAHEAAIRSFARFGSYLYVGSFDQGVSLWDFRENDV